MGMRSAGKPGSRAGAARTVTQPFARLLAVPAVRDAVQPLLGHLHSKLVQLNGERHLPADTEAFAAAALRNGAGAGLAGGLLAWLAGEPAMLAVGALLAGAVPAGQIRDVLSKAERRRQEIVLALPELLSKLMLLVGAGEPVQAALYRCAGDGSSAHPLYKELGQCLNGARNGGSLQASLERFSRRCGVQEASVFTAAVLLNARRGGETFVLALRELSHLLWEKRKAIARKRGEEASSKLVFPLVGLFFTLMVLVGSPALLLMK